MIKVGTKRRKLKQHEYSTNKSEMNLNETDYEIKENKRCVIPYKYEYKTFCKGRWYGMRIIDMFEKEYHSYSLNYYKTAIKLGLITVNSEQITEDYLLKNGDFITHISHRHEPPVLNQPVSIVFENDDYIVINKPPSIPIHPSGAFRYNSVLYILAKEQNKTPLFIIHRLDRLTSGLVMLAKSSAVAHNICNMIENDKVVKTYLAKVDNKFPENEDEYKHSPFYDESKDKYIKWEKDDEKYTIIVSIPTDVVSHREGTYQTTEIGKNTITKFKFIKKNDEDNTSIVKCIPVTGRTHQIRLHLKYLGFPISNDPLYNPKYNLESNSSSTDRDIKPFSDYEIDDSISKETIDLDNIDWNRICPFCIIQNRGEDENIAGFCDNQLNYSEIYLHALQYESDSWKYSVPNPPWL